jgi:CheY-like chemotaxis protein
VTDASILVVDDDPTIRKLLIRRLELDGYSVTAAGGGVEAIRRWTGTRCSSVSVRRSGCVTSR